MQDALTHLFGDNIAIVAFAAGHRPPPETLAPLSPLSYATDLIRIGFGERGHWQVGIDAVVLAAFAIAILAVAYRLHLRTRDRAR